MNHVWLVETINIQPSCIGIIDLTSKHQEKWPKMTTMVVQQVIFSHVNQVDDHFLEYHQKNKASAWQTTLQPANMAACAVWMLTISSVLGCLSPVWKRSCGPAVHTSGFHPRFNLLRCSFSSLINTSIHSTSECPTALINRVSKIWSLQSQLRQENRCLRLKRF